MMPIVNGLEEEFAGEIAVVRRDAASNHGAALQTYYGVRGHPSFAILDADGDVLARFYGPQSAGTLRAAMEQVRRPAR
jgi:hypothetical protein